MGHTFITGDVARRKNPKVYQENGDMIIVRGVHESKSEKDAPSGCLEFWPMDEEGKIFFMLPPMYIYPDKIEFVRHAEQKGEKAEREEKEKKEELSKKAS